MRMDQWWNDTDSGQPNYSEKNLSQCRFVKQKFHMHWPGIEPGPLLWETGDKPPELLQQHKATQSVQSACQLRQLNRAVCLLLDGLSAGDRTIEVVECVCVCVCCFISQAAEWRHWSRMCDVTHRDEGISNIEHTDVPRKVWNKENLLLRLAKIHNLHVLPTQLYLCVLCGSENTQQLFPYTALTDWFL